MKTHEKKRKKTKCHYCEETFYAIANLVIHCKNRHPNLSRGWISKGVKWKLVTKDHRHDLPACDICHKKFSREENLRHHMQTHHSLNRPVFKCNACNNQSFNSKSNWKKHCRNFHPQLGNESFNGFNFLDVENAQSSIDNVAGKLNSCVNVNHIYPSKINCSFVIIMFLFFENQ